MRKFDWIIAIGLGLLVGFLIPVKDRTSPPLQIQLNGIFLPQEQWECTAWLGSADQVRECTQFNKRR